MQDSFLIIFDKIEQYKHKGSFEGWLKRITINTVLQKYRETAPLQIVKEYSDSDEIIDFEFDDKDLDIDLLLKIIQQLPDRYRLVFNLYVLDNYSHKEISKLLSINEGTSKSNLSRAKKILKKQLEEKQKLEHKA